MTREASSWMKIAKLYTRYLYRTMLHQHTIPNPMGYVNDRIGTSRTRWWRFLMKTPVIGATSLKGVLFAHRVSRHALMKFSPFFLLCNRKPILPINIKYDLVDIEVNDSEQPFDREIFDAVLSTAMSMREQVHWNDWWKHPLITQLHLIELLLLFDLLTYFDTLYWILVGSIIWRYHFVPCGGMGWYMLSCAVHILIFIVCVCL